MMSARLWVLLGVMLAGSFSALGQTNVNEEQGMKPYDSWHGGDLDSVSMTNGGMVLHIPLVSFPQRGNLDLSFSVYASSKSWQTRVNALECANPNDPNGCTPQWVPIVRGSQPQFGGAPVEGAYVTSSLDWIVDSECNVDPGNENNGNIATYNWSANVTGPDGSVHQFGSGSSTSSCPGPPFRALDASGILQASNGAIVMPNGTRFFDPLATAIDTNGNKISLNSGLYTDTLGRAVPLPPFTTTSNVSNCPAGSAASKVWSVPGLAGGSRTFTLCYSNISIYTNFGYGGTEYGPISNSLLTAIVLPDSTQWTFSYDHLGDITRVGLPTGGSISYTYAAGPQTCGADTPVSMAVTSRTVDASDGTGGHIWNYAYTGQYIPASGSYSGNTIVTSPAPDLNDTVHTIATPVAGASCSFYDTQVQYYQGSHNGGTLLKTAATQYTGIANPLVVGSMTAANVVPTQTTVTTSDGHTSKVVNTWDSGNTEAPYGTTVPIVFGSLLQKDEYDFSNTLFRSTLNRYIWQDYPNYKTNNLISLQVWSTIYNGAAPSSSTLPACSRTSTPACIGQSRNTYDEGTLASSGIGTPTHVAPPAGEPIRGNLTTSSHWLDTAGAFVSSTSTYFDTGMKATSTDPLGHTTNYTYSGTFQGVYLTQTNIPDTQMPDSGAQVVHHVISGNYDFNTGLLTTFTDENGAQYSYTYESLMLRLTQGNHPDGGITKFFYPDPNTVERQRLISGTTYDDFKVKFDGVGRAYQTLLLTPDCTSYIKVDTVYDTAGRVKSVSNPYCLTTEPTYGTTQTTYDALSRTLNTTKQDGSVTSVKYEDTPGDTSGAPLVCTTATDESGKKRQACSDAFGRLVKVIEPNPGAAAANATGSVTIIGGEQTGNSSVSITVANSGFETPVLGSGANAYQYHPTGSSWTFGPNSGFDSNNNIVGGSGITGNNSGFTSSNPSAPQGAQVAFLQGGSANFISQSLSGFQAGISYTISFQAAQRGNFNTGGQDFDVYLDSTFFATFRPASTSYALLSTPAFTTTAGAHTIKFVGRDSAGGNGNAAFIDAVQVTGAVPISDAGTVTISVSGTSYSTSFGAGDTSTAIASRLATTISAGSYASATSSGGTVNLTSKTAGTIGDYSLTASYTWNSAQFTNPSFTTSTSGPSLSGAKDAAGINNNPFVTIYQYNARGNMLCVHQKATDTTADVPCTGTTAPSVPAAWRQRFFTYDSLSRLLTAMNPEMNSTGSTVITYGYDNGSRLTSKTEPAPNAAWGSSSTVTLTYTYDALNRLLDTTNSDGTTLKASHRYDYATFQGQSFTNPIGREVAALTVNSSGSTVASTFASYDVMGRVANTVQCNPSVSGCKTFTASYDKLGDLTTLAYPGNGFTVTYGYDSAARLTTATDSNGVIYAQTPTYLATGAIQEFTSPNFANNKYHVNYNNRLQPIEIWAGSAQGSPALFDKQYSYGSAGANNGNIYTITNVKDSTRTQSFTYDPLNRLITAGDNGHWANTYTYDAWGNLTNKTPGAPAGENMNQPADSNNHLAGLTYDAAGNVINDGLGGTFVFDGENRIKSAGSVTYTYDADGRRVQKSTGANYWYGPGGNVFAETDSAGNWTTYIFFGGQRLARNIPQTPPAQADIKYYITDHLHSTAMFVDKAGTTAAILDDNDMYPWGGVVPGVGTTTSNNTIKFSGQYRDTDTAANLDYFGARYYSNTIGRFMSPDWAAKPTNVPYAKFGDPQSLNLYSYVENGPINRIDADGHTYASWDGFNADKSGCAGHTDLDNEVDFEAEHDAAGHDAIEEANAASQQQQRLEQAFDRIWNAFPDHEKYDSGKAGTSGQSIQQLTGVNVIDTCALRLSYALNQAGFTITKDAGKSAMRGTDGAYYLVAQKDVGSFLTKTFGFSPQTTGKSGIANFVQNAGSTSGFVRFSIEFHSAGNTATGHIALFKNGVFREPDHDDYSRSSSTNSYIVQGIDYWRMQ
jgi:RHS repeat-associated protein